MPYDIMLGNKTREMVGSGAAAWGLTGHRSVGGEQNCSYLDPRVFPLLHLQFWSPILPGGVE